MSRKLTPYQRIVRNAARGLGVLLTAEEVRDMARDDAIRAVADHDDEESAREGS